MLASDRLIFDIDPSALEITRKKRVYSHIQARSKELPTGYSGPSEGFSSNE
jgi:hypothetical protein